VIWAVEISSASGATGIDITWTPADPSLPQIDLYEARTDEGEAT
jgi:hypothetical protein